MTDIDNQLLAGIRTASRTLVRKFGLLNPNLAGTNYSPSTVHAIIEIGAAGLITGKKLSEILYLEKSSISRLLKNLIKLGEVENRRSSIDSRFIELKLTSKGEQTLRNINAFAIGQIDQALNPLDKKSRDTILNGLKLYSRALNPKFKTPPDREIEIYQGYCPGLIGTIASLHGKIHNDIAGLGAHFECLVAQGLADFIPRIDIESNNIWYSEKEGKIVGSITIDGETLGDNIAHLRWFIVDNTIQSKGIGGQLINKAMDFCDEQDFAEVHLWTYKGLVAAKSLYLKHGFKLVEEKLGSQYGKEVLEQKYVRLS